MQKTQILNITAIVLAAVAAVACLFVGRIPIGQTRAVSIKDFPRQVAEWKDVEDRPEDPSLRAELQSATMVERIYRGSDGQDVDLLLLTASDPGDFHDPTVCLPSQGWQTLNQSVVMRDDQTINKIGAKLDDRVINLMYWQMGDFASKRAATPFMRNLYSLRSILVRNEEGTCLVVRIITHGTPAGEQEALRFIDAIQPSLAQLHATDPQVAMAR